MADCLTCGNGTAVLGYGTTIEVSQDNGATWTLTCGVQSTSGPSSSASEIDVTTLCSTAKEYVLDLKDFGTFEITGLYLPGNEGQAILAELFASGEEALFRVSIPDDGYKNGAVLLEFKARVQSMPITVGQGAANSVTFTLRITGDVTTTLPTDLGPNIKWSTNVLDESAANDGSVSGVISLVLTGDTFAGTIGDPITAVTFTGTPAGLSAAVQKISDTTAIINFSGTATANTSGDSAQIVVNFQDAAFVTGPASGIIGATNRTITINFAD